MRFLALIATFFSLSCQHMVIQRSEKSRPLGAVHDVEVHSFFRGVLPLTKIPSEKEICPNSRIETVELNMSALNVLTSIATLGIYVPHRVTLTCAKELN
jgi:hypothetical protein